MIRTKSQGGTAIMLSRITTFCGFCESPSSDMADWRCRLVLCRADEASCRVKIWPVRDDGANTYHRPISLLVFNRYCCLPNRRRQYEECVKSSTNYLNDGANEFGCWRFFAENLNLLGLLLHQIFSLRVTFDQFTASNISRKTQL